MVTLRVCLSERGRVELPDRDPILESVARAAPVRAFGIMQVEQQEMRMAERPAAGATQLREFAVAAMLEVDPARWPSKPV